jgi:hypothetical protein
MPHGQARPGQGQTRGQPPTPVRPAVPEAEEPAAQEPGEAAPADLDLKLAEEKKGKAQGLPGEHRGLTVACAEFQTACPACGPERPGHRLPARGPAPQGRTVLTLTIQLSGQTLAEGLQAKVVRHDRARGRGGLPGTDPAQEDHVYKIVLEAQRGDPDPAGDPGRGSQGRAQAPGPRSGSQGPQPETHPASGARSAPAAHAGLPVPAKAAQPAPTAARTPAPPDAKAAQPGGQRVPRPAQPAPSGVRPPRAGSQPTGPGPSGTRAETRTVPSAPRPRGCPHKLPRREPNRLRREPGRHSPRPRRRCGPSRHDPAAAGRRGQG